MAPVSSAKFGATLAIVTIVVGLAGFTAGRFTSPIESSPVENSAAAGFARDMQVHHAQGVELATIIRSETNDEEIRLLAYDIETSQQQQSGQMYGWLDMWGLPQRGIEPPMTWMSKPAIGNSDGHVMPTAGSALTTMPGYATYDEVAHLKTLTGRDAEKEFLRLMIVHHEGAIEMAESAIERTDTRVVVQLATATIATQGAEITYMRQLLDARS